MKKKTYLAMLVTLLVMGCDAKEPANAEAAKGATAESKPAPVQVSEESKPVVTDSAPAAAVEEAAPVQSGQPQPLLGADQVDKAIKDAVAKSLRGALVESVLETPIAGIYQVQLNSGEVTHFTQDAKFMFAGDLYQIEDRGIVNLTESGRSVERVKLIATMDDKNLVVFPAAGVEKGQVYVFTDVSCGYCMKFHSEVPELNAKGITVKYAAWPRAGAQSEPGKIMKDVWCSSDRRTAMNNAKSRQPVEPAKESCSGQEVLDQIALGYKMGVRGTPAVYDKEGHQLGGYVPAEHLVQLLTEK